MIYTVKISRKEADALKQSPVFRGLVEAGAIAVRRILFSQHIHVRAEDFEYVIDQLSKDITNITIKDLVAALRIIANSLRKAS